MAEARPLPERLPAPSAPEARGPEDRVVALINEERRRAGLAPLGRDPALEQAARFHAEDMLRFDHFEHARADGPSLTERVTAAGYAYSYVAENIGAGYADPAAVVDGWMNSQGHRENILSAASSDIGVAHVHDPNDGGREDWKHYWVAVFGHDG